MSNKTTASDEITTEIRKIIYDRRTPSVKFMVTITEHLKAQDDANISLKKELDKYKGAAKG